MLAQRRQGQPHYRQPVIQILTELSQCARLHSSRDWWPRSIGCRLLMVCVPPTLSNSRSCNTRSSFTCSAGASSPISSKNTTPPSATSRRPFFWHGRTGEGAALMAKQIALQQSLRNRGAVDGHEWLVSPGGCCDAARAPPVPCPFHSLLRSVPSIQWARPCARNWKISFMRALSPTRLCSCLTSVVSRWFSCSSHCSAPRIVQSDRRNPGNRRHQLQVLFLKPASRAGTVEVDAANHPLKHGEGHAQQRPHLRRHQTFHIAQRSTRRPRPLPESRRSPSSPGAQSCGLPAPVAAVLPAASAHTGS